MEVRHKAGRMEAGEADSTRGTELDRLDHRELDTGLEEALDR